MPIEIRETTVPPDANGLVVQLQISDRFRGDPVAVSALVQGGLDFVVVRGAC